jgi:hypothetical protein
MLLLALLLLREFSSKGEPRRDFLLLAAHSRSIKNGSMMQFETTVSL